MLRQQQWSNSLATLLVIAVGVVLVGPILLLALFSFNDSSVIALPFAGFTLEWYKAALTDTVALTALLNSLSAWSSEPARPGLSPGFAFQGDQRRRAW
jgi:ABC-type spermidine/putrescine transport system permease subunit II